MSRISLFKPESLRAHERLGAQRLGDALFFTGKQHQVVLFNLPPYLHMGGPEAAPRCGSGRPVKCVPRVR